MPLPYNLDKLPPEMLDVLRLLGGAPNSVRAADIGGRLGMHDRIVLRAIRRLVNFNLIGMDAAGAYLVTSEGQLAYAALIEADGLPRPTAAAQPKQRIQRRLTAVLPGSITSGQTGAVYIGVDPLDPALTPLPGPVTVDLKLRALGAQLSATMTTLSIPEQGAAAPVRVLLRPTVSDKPIRLIIDAYQAFQVAELAPAGNMYTDIPVTAPGAGSLPRRAVATPLDLIED